MICLRVLGSVELHDPQGRELTSIVSQPKRLALLSYLALKANGFHRRDSLLALFWPELDDAHARAALNQATRFLRKELGGSADSIILSRGFEEIGLNRAQLWCDAAAFRDQIAAQRFEEALALYRGNLLEGFFVQTSPEFDVWLEAERTALRAQAARTAMLLAETQEHNCDFATAVVNASRALDLSALDERLLRHLLELLDRLGDRAGAVHAYETFAKRLAQELDVQPDAETAALIERIRARPHLSVRDETDASVSRSVDERPRMDLKRAQQRAAPPPKTRRRRGRTIATVGAIMLVALGATGFWWLENGASRSNGKLDDNLIAVLPFTVRTSDSSYNYLREGLIDLVGARLTGDALPRIVDTRAIMSAYKREIARAGEDLSVEQSVQLARRLGAGRLLVGELVVTHGGVSVSARLIQVASGRVLTSHSESGTGSELALFLRFTDVLFAKSLGERTSRLSALSDRPEAIKAYLAGMQEQRAYHPLRAYNFFDQALQSDPNFAPAALWRAYAAWGAFTFGTSEKRRADSAAWAHRARFSRRDSLLLAALPSIGPNYPNPSTAIELLQAQERAARANPDRPEVWADWSTHLRAWGQQAGLARPLELAAFAADSAIALDSNFVPALSQRYYVALLQHDSSGVRRYGQLLDQAGHSEKGNPSLRWAGARLLGDSAHLEEWFARMVELSRPPFNVEIWSAYYGLASVEDAERFTRVRLARSDTTAASERQALWRTLFRIAILRGEHRRALALVDSAEFVEGVIHLSLAENAYDADAARAVRVLEARIDTTSNQQMRANGLCEIQMWRASRRDTLRTRAAMAEMRVIINTIDAAPGWRVGRLGLCPLLLDAILENGAGDAGGRNALRDLQTLLRKGTLTESPGNVAYLIAARQLEAQGQPGLALELIRRRDPMAWQIIHPASWRLEGRLASKVGDKAGAIHAYRRFLEIRDKADPGPVADEVIAVRKELQHLVSATKTQ